MSLPLLKFVTTLNKYNIFPSPTFKQKMVSCNFQLKKKKLFAIKIAFITLWTEGDAAPLHLAWVSEYLAHQSFFLDSVGVPFNYLG